MKVALVTGVAGGIGSATAAVLSRAGYRVVGVDRQDAAPAAAGYRYLRVDLVSPLEIVRLVTSMADEEGRLDALVNNAAIQVSRPVLETSAEEWDRVMAVNLRAAFLLARESVPLLRRRGGAIVNVASVHAVATSVGVAAYAASKGGLVALTRALAIELAPDRIRVNAVLPGAVDTPMLESGLRRGHLGGGEVEQLKAELARRTVAERIGRPVEIAEAIGFLIDVRRSGFITGQSLIVDGGATARLSTE